MVFVAVLLEHDFCLLIVRRDVSREDSLLGLFSLEFEGRQWVQLLVVQAPCRRWCITAADIVTHTDAARILVIGSMIHARVH